MKSLAVAALIPAFFMPAYAACPADPDPDIAFIPVESADGRARVEASHFNDDYFRLSATLQTQHTQTMCSIASSVTVLNAMSLEKPRTAYYFPYAYFTQESFFTDEVSRVASLAQVLEKGMTLEQIAGVLKAHGAKVSMSFANERSLDDLREALKRITNAEDEFLIANFLRTPVGQAGGGHFSPIAAYHEESDSVLIMDVARYKYTPAWVPLGAMFEAMKCPDSDSHKSRGWVTVSTYHK